MYSYLKELTRLICNEPQLKISHCLKDLFRMLVYFLIDLDDNNIENKSEISKTVNKIILSLLEIAETRHMVEILFMLLRGEMERDSSVKLQHLLVKCMGKITQNPKFR